MHGPSHSLGRRTPQLAALIAALVAAAVLTLIATTTSDATSAPHARAAHARALVVVRRDPATIRGTGFRAHTRVRVTLAAARTYVRRPRADRHGVFTVTFPAVIDRCTGWTVTARQGAAAPLVVRGPKPMCAPASTP